MRLALYLHLLKVSACPAARLTFSTAPFLGSLPAVLCREAERDLFGNRYYSTTAMMVCDVGFDAIQREVGLYVSLDATGDTKPKLPNRNSQAELGGIPFSWWMHRGRTVALGNEIFVRLAFLLPISLTSVPKRKSGYSTPHHFFTKSTSLVPFRGTSDTRPAIWETVLPCAGNPRQPAFFCKG